MKEYETTLNGKPVAISNHLEIPEEYQNTGIITDKEKSGSLSFSFEPNYLYKRQQQTGRPRLVKIMPW